MILKFLILNMILNFNMQFICVVFALILVQTTGGRRSNEKELITMLIPCSWEDALFQEGVCVHCVQPLKAFNRFYNCPVAEFTREYAYIYKQGKLRRHATSLFIATSLNNKSSTCSHTYVGCLRGSFEALESWRVKEGTGLLKERTIRIVTIERHPFVKITANGEYTGVCFELMNALREKYNFSMRIFLPYDGNWGTLMPNGTWNGMVGQVLRQEADMGVAGFSVTLQRSQIIEFSSSYYQEETALLIPPPAVSGPKLTILVRPLSNLVWVSLFFTIIVLAPTLYFMHVTSLSLAGEKEKKSFGDLVGELLHFMVGSLVQESVISPVNKTTRFLIILWWFLTLTIANVYVAQLVSYLSAPKLSNVINTLEDLVKQDGIKWTFRKNTAHQSLFQSATSSGVYKLVGDGVSQEDLVTSDAEGIAKVLTGDYAFVKEKSFLDVALGQDFRKTGGKCRLTVAKEKFFKVETALILPKKSKYLKLINKEITRSVTTGLMEKWKSIHWENLLWCEDAINYIPTTLPPIRKLGIGDLLGAWFLLGCGTLASILGFWSEFLKRRFRRRMETTFLR